MDRAEIDVVDLQVAKVTFDVCKGLVGIDDAGCIESVGLDRGAQYVDAVEGGFGRDGVFAPGQRQRVLADGDLEMLGHLELVDHLADLEPDLVGPAQASLSNRGDDGASTASVAAKSSARLRARSSAKKGWRQATSRSPG